MNKYRVMIVDDVKQVREDLRTLLSLSERINIVAEAQNGMEAVEKVRLQLPDVVLMDLEMPVLDGFEATSRIKSMQPAPRVIVLSVHDSFAEREHARLAGADRFLVKGSSFEEIEKAILERNEPTNTIYVEKGKNP